MYNVNKGQIDIRLQYISKVTETLRLLREDTQSDRNIHQFALERALHIAAECVTDIGNYMIDGFVMRDAASYEDIVDILYGEHVFPTELYEQLTALVRLRKPLVQSYYAVEYSKLLSLSHIMPETLEQFGSAIVLYISNELGDSNS